MSARNGIQRTPWIGLATRCGFIGSDELKDPQETGHRKLASVLDHACRRIAAGRTDRERSLNGIWILFVSSSASSNYCSLHFRSTAPGCSNFKVVSVTSRHLGVSF